MSREPQSGSRWRRALAFVAAWLYLGTATAALVLLRFPLDRVLASATLQIERQGGPRLEVGPARLGWLFSVFLEGLQAELRLPRGPATLELEQIEVHPDWGSVVFGRPGVWVRAAAYGGRVELEAKATDRTATRLESARIVVEHVDLSTAGVLEQLSGGRFQGLVEAAAELDVAGPAPADWRGHGRILVAGLDLQNVALGGLTMEHLPLGRAEVELEIAEGSAELRLVRCEVSGSEVEIVATGRVVLAPDPTRSRLEIQVRLRLSGRTLETMGDAVSLMGFPPDESGWLRLTVAGTLNNPQVTPGH